MRSQTPIVSAIETSRHSKKLEVASVFFSCAVCLVACSSRPEKKLLGMWQLQASPRYDMPVSTNASYTQVKVAFFKDGTVVESERDEKSGVSRSWDHAYPWLEETGTFHLIDPTHLKIDLGWSGPTIYEIEWQDNDHLKLQLDDVAIQLERVK